MGLFDTFKGNQYKAELEKSQAECERLKSLFTPEMQQADALQRKIEELQNEISTKENEIASLSSDISKKNNEINSLNDTIHKKHSEISWMDDEIIVQEFGLYQPHYDFASALDYKEELAKIRAKQKELIKNKNAVSGSTEWTVNGSVSKGKKMVSDTQKLLMRAFNSECDDLISRVKYTNFDATLDRIYKSAEAISKLGTIMSISITQPYLNAKVKELRLAFEYQQKKQQEKEELKAARAEQREQARIQKEIEEQRKRIEKEQTHYQTAYEHLQLQLQQKPDDADLLEKQDHTDIEREIERGRAKARPKLRATKIDQIFEEWHKATKASGFTISKEAKA